jgi:hypothetical protein
LRKQGSVSQDELLSQSDWKDLRSALYIHQ